ncbi:MAG: MATE family efflux transporter [Prevotellaceae bacterium]|jgi:putative MATE family efflux protein|nr:MATE family efflux transporter [Prevotellaceae bacterium]
MSSQFIPTGLGTEKISKLLRQYAVPAIIAMTASSLYNMVDSIFIGQGVGALAISGLAVTFPFMNIAAAFGTLVGIGAGTLISVKLGQKDYISAQKVLGNVFMLNIAIGILFTIASLIFLDPILYFFGASENTIRYAHEYMEIILYGNVITHLYFGLNNVLRSSGHPRKAMMLTITTVILNTILDPIFIFAFGWGIKGAAIATVLAQFVSLVWQVRIFMNKNELLHFRKRIFNPDSRLVKDMLAIGLSPFLMNVASCFIVILVNNAMKKHSGDLAIGAFGIVNRLVFICVMIVMGLNQGMQPVAGYNYGARKMSRVLEALKITAFFATIVTTAAFLAGELIPGPMTRIFTSDEELVALSVYGLRLTVMFFPLIGAQIVIANFFQSIGMAGKAIFLSLIRQVLVLIPCLIVLPELFGLTGVWISSPVADIVACVVSTIMIIHQIKKLKTGQI